MTRFMHLCAGVAAVSVVIGMGGLAGWAQDKETVVKDRQALMKEQSANLKAIKDYIDGNGTDQATAVQKAQDMVALADKIPTLFPAGTSSTDMPGKTHAKPEIWQEQDKFKAIPPVIKAADEKLLEAVQKGDKAAAQAALGDVGKNGCGACHGTFREKI